MICIRPVLWAGSEGSHPHPLSSPQMPKQFLSLLEADSPFQDTLERVSDPEFLPPLILTTPSQRAFVEDQCDEIGFDYEDVLVLGEADQSAAACLAAAEWSKERSESFPLFITPCDHFIADQGAFMRAVIEAAYTAEQGYFVTFGVVAERVQTQFSYIEVGNRLDAGYSGHEVLRFVEKPAVENVEAFLETGRFVWNAGLICATPDLLSQALDGDCVKEQTIEAAVLVKNERVCVVSLLTAWADLNTWPGVWKSLKLVEI